MAKRLKPLIKPAGQSPGTLTYVGKQTLRNTRVTLTEYDEHTHRIIEIPTLNECALLRPSSLVSWINVDGIGNPEAVSTIGKAFGLHPLLLEDVLNTEQKPKIEHYDQAIFVVMKMMEFNPRTHEIETEHVSLVLGPSFLISFQEEREGDPFDPVRLRLTNALGRIRRSGADYLFYALMDTIVDNYFVVLENLGERLEELEGEIINNAGSQSQRLLYAQKRELILMRKFVWP
ncbi:MAG: magnesium and cobalt transport protein CorA, partial [Ferruginibacter sp.]|nr:magnesium and cobalt transport protein CorA [Cytophagales bacterium]